MRQGESTQLFVLVLALAIVAIAGSGCARLMDVDEPILGDPTTDASLLSSRGESADGGDASAAPASSSTTPTPSTPPACSREADDCPGASYCNDAGRCVPGCKNDDDCAGVTAAAPRCNVARHQCVACLDDSGCANGQRCSPAGTCAERCDSEGGTCAGGKTCCAGLCLDTNSDELNCGGCGIVCDATNAKATCAGGTCHWSCARGTAHCGDGNTGCETDLDADPANCGACGNACANHTSQPSACLAGTCTLTACAKFTGDCDGNPDNGCECVCGKKNGAGSQCCPGNVCFVGTCQPNGTCN